MGTGYLAFTVDQGKQRYQGIVPIEAADLKLCLNGISVILNRSIQSCYRSAAGDDGWHASALLLQRIPEAGGSAWKPVAVLPMMRIWISGIRPAR